MAGWRVRRRGRIRRRLRKTRHGIATGGQRVQVFTQITGHRRACAGDVYGPAAFGSGESLTDGQRLCVRRTLKRGRRYGCWSRSHDARLERSRTGIKRCYVFSYVVVAAYALTAATFHVPPKLPSSRADPFFHPLGFRETINRRFAYVRRTHFLARAPVAVYYFVRVKRYVCVC